MTRYITVQFDLVTPGSAPFWILFGIAGLIIKLILSRWINPLMLKVFFENVNQVSVRLNGRRALMG
jgi:hypothetical protein